MTNAEKRRYLEITLANVHRYMAYLVDKEEAIEAAMKRLDHETPLCSFGQGSYVREIFGRDV